MSAIFDRMLRAARLEPGVYEEVEADPGAMGQAVMVVLLSSLAVGIGSLGQAGVGEGLILGTIVALIAWVVWAFLTWIIGTRLLPEERTEADMGQLMRTIGFSAAPGVLRVVGFIPVLGPLVVLVATVWMLVAMVVAVRQALDFTSTWRAVAVCVLGWLVLLGVQLLLIQLVGSPRPA